jgi:uncharacterized membrane protein
MSSSPPNSIIATRAIDPLFQLGRWFFAAGIAFFAFQYLFYGHYLGGTPPVPPWAPGGAAGTYALGILLLAAGIGLVTPQFGRWSALIVGALYLACIVFLHLPHTRDVIFSGQERTRALEPLSLAAAAFTLAAVLRTDHATAEGPVSDAFLRRFGIVVFALALPVYGYQHFEYFSYLANLVPAWMPAHKFLIGFTGVAFIAAGLAILFRIMARTAAIWLGIMFFVFTVTLHAPRVNHNPHNADEWASLFVALAMCGASWIIATAVKPATR